MKNTELIKKTLEYQKEAFETLFKTVATVQEEGMKAAGEAVEKSAFLPAEGKAVAQKWLAASKEAGEKFRETVLKGHEQVEQLLKTA